MKDLEVLNHLLPPPEQSLPLFSFSSLPLTHTIDITHFYPSLFRPYLGSKKKKKVFYKWEVRRHTNEKHQVPPWICAGKGPLQFWAHCSDLFPAPYLSQNPKEEHRAHTSYI